MSIPELQQRKYISDIIKLYVNEVLLGSFTIEEPKYKKFHYLIISPPQGPQFWYDGYVILNHKSSGTKIKLDFKDLYKYARHRIKDFQSVYDNNFNNLKRGIKFKRGHKVWINSRRKSWYK